jgi:YHS domain-containing protein
MVLLNGHGEIYDFCSKQCLTAFVKARREGTRHG